VKKPPLNSVLSLSGTPEGEEIPKMEAKGILLQNVVCIIDDNKK
jgi:hypothetical protein